MLAGINQIHGLHILREGSCFPCSGDFSREIQPLANRQKSMSDEKEKNRATKETLFDSFYWSNIWGSLSSGKNGPNT
jgi:hypothetical protein